MREISLGHRAALLNQSREEDPILEGKTICAALEILIEKDGSLEDENDTRFMKIIMELENFRRARGIDYSSRWGDRRVVRPNPCSPLRRIRSFRKPHDRLIRSLRVMG